MEVSETNDSAHGFKRFPIDDTLSLLSREVPVAEHQVYCKYSQKWNWYTALILSVNAYGLFSEQKSDISAWINNTEPVSDIQGFYRTGKKILQAKKQGDTQLDY